MTQDITAIIDGIKRSVEAVGRSGHEEIHLDNVSFRVDASKLDIPHDSSVRIAEIECEEFIGVIDVSDYDHSTGQIYIVYDKDIDSDIIAIQLLPTEIVSSGRRVSMTVTIASSDVTNSLPQTVLNCEMFFRTIAERIGARPGRITFNIAHAYVLWDDVEQIVEWDDIEIPR
jgi:hypothetical protein